MAKNIANDCRVLRLPPPINCIYVCVCGGGGGGGVVGVVVVCFVVSKANESYINIRH